MLLYAGLLMLIILMVQLQSASRLFLVLSVAPFGLIGMVPIAPTVFWGPMAYAIMGGLAVATLLTLVFLPALYVAWFRIREHEPAPLSTASP